MGREAEERAHDRRRAAIRAAFGRPGSLNRWLVGTAIWVFALALISTHLSWLGNIALFCFGALMVLVAFNARALAVGDEDELRAGLRRQRALRKEGGPELGEAEDAAAGLPEHWPGSVGRDFSGAPPAPILETVTAPSIGDPSRLDAFFAGYGEARAVFGDLLRAIEALGPIELRVTKSQISFTGERAFAWAWVPGRYLRGNTAPLVLSLALSRRDESERWKEIVEPTPGRFMHHLELWSGADVDAQVREWLREAFRSAAPPGSGMLR